jgi:crotonobetainyl-CoA:carnitine CoA-transferase CaiB-like acyl-CoA transferase
MAGALDGLFVLELGDTVPTAYCGRLFAGFGATVVKVEPDGGSRLRRMRVVPGAPVPDPEEAPAWLYLGAGKRSVTVPVVTAAFADAWRLGVDVIIAGPGNPFAGDVRWSADAISAVNPRAVYLSLTPYGDWGPYAGWEAENINAFGMGVQMWLTGEPDREPLCTGGEQAWMQLGQSGFSAALVALREAERSGLGQRVEVAAAEVIAGATEGFGPNARYLGVAQGRSGRARFALFGVYPCLDGYAGVYGTNRQIKVFAPIAGRPELADDPRFATLGGMLRANDELSELAISHFATVTRADVRHVARETGMTMAPVETLADVLASEHLAERRFFAAVETPTGRQVTMPGRPLVMHRTPWQVGAAPTLGAAAGSPPVPAPRPRAAVDVNPRDRHHAGPLSGLKVLDFTAYWAGPYATKWLADFGAEVVKVESPGLMDFIRSTSNDFTHERPYDVSAYWNNYNRGKLSLALDPATAAGRALVFELLPHFDVVVENFKAGRMGKLGLSYEELRAVKPGLIMVSVSGYGQDGPDSSLAGVGTNMEQLSGLVSLNRYQDADQPYNTGIAYGDPTSGTAGAAAVLLALRHRDRTGEGQYVEVSGHETIISLYGEQYAAMSLGLEPVAKGNRHPDMAPHGCYPCAGDDRWVTIAVQDDARWGALCAAMGQPELAARWPSLESRLANQDEIDAHIIGWTVDKERDSVAGHLQAHGVAAAPLLSSLDTPRDPHFRARGYYVTVEHPDQGAWPIDGIAWRLQRTPGAVRAPAPRFGQHTGDVLRRYLDVPDDRLAELYAAGAIADRPYRV